MITTLVSNIDQAAATANRNNGLSQAFTTGSHASGYVLTGVEIASASTTAFTARVCGTNTRGEPTLPCTDLTAPGSFAVGGNSFTAPADTHLTSATTYAVVVTGDYDEGLSFGRTEADGEDAGHATGWSIADSAFHGAVSLWTFTGETPKLLRIAIKGYEAANAPPVFASTAETREVPENSAAGTNVGAVIPAATDLEDDNDTLTYSMAGTDAGSFAFDASTRQITTITNVDYNHEATKNSYSVTVTATDSSGGTDTVAVTINVTDVDEQPDKPDPPTLAAVTGSSTALLATWAKPGLNGGPDIIGYRLQYREGTSGSWNDPPLDAATDPTTEIRNLTPDTPYQARVRALNGTRFDMETPSDWSDPSDAVRTYAVGETITSVEVTSTPRLTSSGASEPDTYGAGEEIRFTVTFSGAVDVTGDPVFRFWFWHGGGSQRPVEADYASGSGSTSLVFTYTVMSTDVADGGIYLGAGSGDFDSPAGPVRLDANDAITGAGSTTPADLIYDPVGGGRTEAGHKVDGSRTYVTSVVVANAPQSGDTYRLYETILFTVTFSEPVRVEPHGRLRLEVELDDPGGASGSTVEAVFSGLTRSQYPTADTPQIRAARHMHFEYKVKLFDRDVDGVSIGANALRLGPGVRIRNEVGDDAELDHAAVGPLSGHKVDGSADGSADVPMIERIEVASTPRLRWRNSSEEADTYGEGETIRIEVRFDEPVHVEGEPALALEVGDPCESVCEARYESGSGTDTLVFAYLVLGNELDRNGIAIPADPIRGSSDDLEGFRIRNDAGQEAHLSFRREGTQSGHKVDGRRAAGQHFWVEDAEAHEADREMEFTVRLEPRGLGIVTVGYATRDGSARAGSDYTETSGTLRFNPLERERTVTVPIIDDAHEDDGETFRLRLSNPQGALLWSADREGTGTIRNSDPEAALTASFPASAFASASHTGADDRPQVVVAFSEPVAAFGADTPSVSVTGGAVASVGPHAEGGLKNAWVFFLAPDGGGDVTFALVADAACASGGICTAGGKALTEVPAAATVPGPGGPAEPAGPRLTASFEGLPAAHDGASAFRFRVAFSEPIAISFRSLREDAFQVAGGRVTRGTRVDGRKDLFEITVEPDGDGELTIALPAGRDCAVSGAICTWGPPRKRLTNTPTATVAGPDRAPANAPAEGAPTIAGTPRVGGTLSASTSDISDADGLADASFAYQWMRTDADISGCDRPGLHGGGGRRGRAAEGAGELHRRRRPRGEPDERGDRRGRGPAGAADGVVRGRAGGA